METFEPSFDSQSRSYAARLLLATCLAFSSAANAQTIYKCVDAQNRIAFQQTPCESGKRESEVAIKPLPPPPPASSTVAPSRKISSFTEDLVANIKRAPKSSQQQSVPVEQSYECTFVHGGKEVFYQHSPCPEEIYQGSTPVVNNGRRGYRPYYLLVTGKPVPRAVACKNMRSAGRSGRKYDQQISTYDRNLGRDQ